MILHKEANQAASSFQWCLTQLNSPFLPTKGNNWTCQYCEWPKQYMQQAFVLIQETNDQHEDCHIFFLFWRKRQGHLLNWFLYFWNISGQVDSPWSHCSNVSLNVPASKESWGLVQGVVGTVDHISHLHPNFKEESQKPVLMKARWYWGLKFCPGYPSSS